MILAIHFMVFLSFLSLISMAFSFVRKYRQGDPSAEFYLLLWVIMMVVIVPVHRAFFIAGVLRGWNILGLLVTAAGVALAQHWYVVHRQGQHMKDNRQSTGTNIRYYKPFK